MSAENPLDALTLPRGPDCPSDLTLSERLADTLTEERLGLVEAHVRTCARCQSWLEEARTSFDTLDAREGKAVIERITQGSARAPRRIFGPLGVAAAAVIALFSITRAPILLPEGPTENEVTSKGREVGFRVFRERDGHITEVQSGADFAEYDRLRFELNLPEAAEVMVVGLEASGRLYRAFPMDSDRSVSLSPGAQLLSGAIELDAAPGRERLYLVACPKPFEVSELQNHHPPQVSTQEACRYRDFELDKERR